MKSSRKNAVTSLLVLALAALLILPGCSKKDEEEETGNNGNSNVPTTYTGTLALYFTNSMPPMYADDKMDVFIDKNGEVTIDIGIIQYSGEIVIEDDSKIERSGLWEMTPTGSLVNQGGQQWVKINAHIEVIDDIQKIYAKDNNGQWQLMYEVSANVTPNSELAFPLNDCILNDLGAKIEVSNEMGSISWFLLLAAGN